MIESIEGKASEKLGGRSRCYHGYMSNKAFVILWYPSRAKRKDLAIPLCVGLRSLRVESRVLHSGVTV